VKLLDRMFTPQWAGGWNATRILFVVVALYSHVPRILDIEDAYASQDMVFSQYPFRFNNHFILTPESATVFWAIGIAGCLMVLWGGRLAKLGVCVFLFGSWVLLVSEALNIKAYDRVLTWFAWALLLSPIGERRLSEKYRSPVGRWFLVWVYIALYGSTGFHKLIMEPQGWLSGEILSLHTLHRYFGMKPLGIWASDNLWVTAPLSWYTLIFECFFPFLIWWRRTSHWVLLAGALMHLGILLMMHVGPFSYVAVAAYPALLHPETARDWWGRWQRWRARAGAEE
jgi:hypothetical protein